MHLTTAILSISKFFVLSSDFSSPFITFLILGHQRIPLQLLLLSPHEAAAVRK